jgi:hypothetical protein
VLLLLLLLLLVLLPQLPLNRLCRESTNMLQPKWSTGSRQAHHPLDTSHSSCIGLIAIQQLIHDLLLLLLSLHLLLCSHYSRRSSSCRSVVLLVCLLLLLLIGCSSSLMHLCQRSHIVL